MRGGGRLATFLLLFAHHFLARLLALLARGELAPLLELRARPVDALQHPGAELVHDLEPRDAQEQRHAREPQPEQQQRRAEKAQALRCCAAPTSSPSTPPALLGKAGAVPVQRRQGAARDRVSTNPAARSKRIDARARLRQRAIPCAPASRRKPASPETDTPAGRTEIERIRPARRPTGPIQLLTGPGLAGIGEARIVRVVGEQRQQQEQRERTTRPTACPRAATARRPRTASRSFRLL